MAQEFTIKSQAIEDKINQLLPSQGGFQAGVDFSASTMVIPIVDLTETAEGSEFRQDLQSSLSLNSITGFNLVNSSATIIATTGYYRIFGTSTIAGGNSATDNNKIVITDGITSKNLFYMQTPATTANHCNTIQFDFIALLQAGDSVVATATGAAGFAQLHGNTRQIADLSGNLVNP